MLVQELNRNAMCSTQIQHGGVLSRFDNLNTGFVVFVELTFEIDQNQSSPHIEGRQSQSSEG